MIGFRENSGGHTDAQPSIHRDTDLHQMHQLAYGKMPTPDSLPYAAVYN